MHWTSLEPTSLINNVQPRWLLPGYDYIINDMRTGGYEGIGYVFAIEQVGSALFYN